LKDQIAKPSAVIDIKGIDALNGITYSGKQLTLGALVTFTDLIESDVVKEHFPLITEMAKTVASVAVRNRATVAGNICSAVPCMDSAPVLYVYDAHIHVTGPNEKREIPISQWFKNVRETALKKDEIVTHISIPLPAENHAGCFAKLGRYAGEDLAQANVAVLVLQNNQYRVSFGSVAPVPIRAKKIEEALNGKPVDEKTIKTAQQLLPQEIKPITDIRATKEYRMHMWKGLLERSLKTAAERLEPPAAKNLF
jgi:carbon-monoxide dehydrogenase medium subunit